MALSLVKAMALSAVIRGGVRAIRHTDGNALRLALIGLHGGRLSYLDVLELEAIICLPEERLASRLDPSRSSADGMMLRSWDEDRIDVPGHCLII